MTKAIRLVLFFLVLGTVIASRADQVVMQNGDKLNGKVLSMTTNTLVMQNDNLGTITLPRSRIASLVFDTPAATSSLPVTSPTNAADAQVPDASQTNSDPELAAEFRGLRADTNLIQQVEKRFLGSADPAAMNKFNELLDGLSSGKIDMNELRAEAQSAADQLRDMKKDMGTDPTGETDMYLSILDSFLRETAPASADTNSIAP